MRRVTRWLVYGVLGTGLLAASLVGTGVWWIRQSLPQMSGTLSIDGLNAPVTIVRDAHAVPHIEAASFADALFAQGFVHAQDRLWQMEFHRRVGAGRLSEVVGPDGLPVDRFMRLLGLYRAAEASLDHLSPKTRAWLDAYAAGVNAFLRSRSGPLPPEFILLNHDSIEPWRPADSLVWIKLMALDLSRNWRDELLRAQLAKVLDDAQIADLWPDYPQEAPITLARLARGLSLDSLAAVLPGRSLEGKGSNAWVVSKAHARLGAPLLANDPHLGLRVPGTWYLAHLKAPELEIIGAGLPGVPGIVLGHNGEVAWGMTNTGPDTQDLFIEKIDPEDQARYLTPEGSSAFGVRIETIRIKGEENAALRVRSTRHGPVISDLVEASFGVLPPDQVLTLAWTALVEDDTSLEALLLLASARSWDQFVAAARLHVAPQQNLFYADQSGHVGFIAPGKVPVRKRGDGRWPVPGWSGEYDWQGFIPFEALPRQVDPKDGRLWNANNRIVADNYPYLVTADWEPPYRARRIGDLLGALNRHDLESFAQIQADQLSLVATDFLPLMLDVAPQMPLAQDVVAALRSWDGVMRPKAPEPLIFAAWYRELSRLIYADELGPLFASVWNIKAMFMDHVLRRRQAWCDDVRTASLETCLELKVKALDLALADLRERHGEDWRSWRWEDDHFAYMTHPVLENVPVLNAFFNIEEPLGGDSATVNVAHYAIWDDAQPFATIQAASYRGLYDLDDLDRSRYVAATGQAGHPLSPHYRDLTSIWARGETISMNRDPAIYGAAAIGRLILRPEGAPKKMARISADTTR